MKVVLERKEIKMIEIKRQIKEGVNIPFFKNIAYGWDLAIVSEGEEKYLLKLIDWKLEVTGFIEYSKKEFLNLSKKEFLLAIRCLVKMALDVNIAI